MTDRLFRTFISLPVPEEVAEIQQRLRSTIGDNPGIINWTHPGMIHLTLQFLGPTPENMVTNIKSILDDIAQNNSRFDIHISGTGCFPTPKRARILWLGVKGDTQPLMALGNSIRHKMTEIGFPPDENELLPHITIGRIQYPIKNSPDISPYLSVEFDPIAWKPKYFHLIRSELFPNGPVYTILGTHILQN